MRTPSGGGYIDCLGVNRLRECIININLIVFQVFKYYQGK
jgi:hypothetical protein